MTVGCWSYGQDSPPSGSFYMIGIASSHHSSGCSASLPAVSALFSGLIDWRSKQSLLGWLKHSLNTQSPERETEQARVATFPARAAKAASPLAAPRPRIRRSPSLPKVRQAASFRFPWIWLAFSLVRLAKSLETLGLEAYWHGGLSGKGWISEGRDGSAGVTYLCLV